MKNVLKNLVYQVVFQLSKIIIPIITIPIVSRNLGANGIGVYNFTFSVVNYFVLVAGLGVSLYGNREIAVQKSKTNDVSLAFWEIFGMKAIISLLVLLVYLIFILFTKYQLLFLIQIISILAVFLDVSWFFMGLEDFKKTSLINISSQLIIFVAIMIFVRRPEDLSKYIFLQSFAALLPNLLILPFMKKHIRFARVSLGRMLHHLKESILYFIPQVSITLYTNLNKTLLGLFIGTLAVGYYSNALVLNNVFITIITTIDLVLLPRMSSLFSQNKESEMMDILKKTLNFQLFFSIAMMFGWLVVFDKLVPWFFGEKFLFVNRLIPFFSILIIIVPLGMSISRQYLLPKGNTKDYIVSVTIGAVANILLNIVLLPTIGIFGVVISNILSESLVTITRLVPLLKIESRILDWVMIAKYLLSGFVMCLITRLLTASHNPSIVTNMKQALIGATIYIILTIVLKANPVWDLLINIRKNK